MKTFTVVKNRKLKLFSVVVCIHGNGSSLTSVIAHGPETYAVLYIYIIAIYHIWVRKNNFRCKYVPATMVTVNLQLSLLYHRY